MFSRLNLEAINLVASSLRNNEIPSITRLATTKLGEKDSSKLNKLGQLSPWKPTRPNSLPPPFDRRFKFILGKKDPIHEVLYYIYIIREASRVHAKKESWKETFVFLPILEREPPVGYHCSLSPCKRARANRERKQARVEDRGERERERGRTLWRLTPSTTRQPSLTLALDSLSLVSSTAALFISHTLHPAPRPVSASSPSWQVRVDLGPAALNRPSLRPTPSPPPYSPSRNPSRQRFQWSNLPSSTFFLNSLVAPRFSGFSLASARRRTLIPHLSKIPLSTPSNPRIDWREPRQRAPLWPAVPLAKFFPRKIPIFIHSQFPIRAPPLSPLCTSNEFRAKIIWKDSKGGWRWEKSKSCAHL